jgi:hypothetical protein
LKAWIKQPNWKHEFWGSNYERLSQIKTKWDPNMVFYVTPGINADLMTVKNGRMCFVQGTPAKLANDMAPVGDNENIAVRPRDPVSFVYIYNGPGKPAVVGLGARPRATAASKAGLPPSAVVTMAMPTSA